MKTISLYSYILFFAIVIIGRDDSSQFREVASEKIKSCENLIKPILEHNKLTKDFVEVFEKGYLNKDEVNLFKESSLAISALKSSNLSFEERNYAFAIMALLKKRYHYLDIESTIAHYKSIYRKC